MKPMILACISTLALSASLAMTSMSQAEFLEGNTIVVGSDLTQPPYNYYDENKVESGFDSELLNALAEQMGKKTKFVDTRFENLILGLQGRKFDVIASAIYVKPARAEVIDFIPYMKAGVAIAARAGDANAPKLPEELCGKRIGVTKGSAEVNFLKLTSDQCVARSQKPIDAREYPTGPEIAQALMAGNVDAEVNDAGQLKRAVDNTGGRLAITSAELYFPAVVGLGVRKGNPEVKSALEEALKKIKENGQYDKLLKKYNLAAPTPEEIKAAMTK